MRGIKSRIQNDTCVACAGMRVRLDRLVLLMVSRDLYFFGGYFHVRLGQTYPHFNTSVKLNEPRLDQRSPRTEYYDNSTNPASHSMLSL